MHLELYGICSPCGIYLQKPLNHMPNVVKIITERASELAATDKVVYYFNPRVSLIPYGSTEQPTGLQPWLFSNTRNLCSLISRTAVLSGLVNFMWLVKFSKQYWSCNGILAYGMGTSYVGNWYLTAVGVRKIQSDLQHRVITSVLSILIIIGKNICD